MEQKELKLQQVTPIHFQSPVREEAPPLMTYGINGGHAFVTGICCIDGTVLERQPYNQFTGEAAETVDRLMIRAAKASVKGLAYLIYEGLPADHCRPKA